MIIIFIYLIRLNTVQTQTRKININDYLTIETSIPTDFNLYKHFNEIKLARLAIITNYGSLAINLNILVL